MKKINYQLFSVMNVKQLTINSILPTIIKKTNKFFKLFFRLKLVPM